MQHTAHQNTHQRHVYFSLVHALFVGVPHSSTKGLDASLDVSIPPDNKGIDSGNEGVQIPCQNGDHGGG